MNYPTEHGVRNDGAGGGYFGAPRGNRFHTGIDWLTFKGESIKCPWDTATFIRVIYPYADDLSWKGGVYEVRDKGDKYFSIIYYMNPIQGYGRFRKGEIIGTAQDITERYENPDMQAHIHVELFKPFNYLSKTERR